MSKTRERTGSTEPFRPIGPLDFQEARLGNSLRTKRLVQIATTLSSAPDQSYPRLMESAELEGYYRFVNNDRVDPKSIVAAHAEATRARIAPFGTALAIHDTSEIEYSGKGTRDALEQMGVDRQGLRGHFTLAVSADGARRPLGVLALESWTRVGKPKLTKAQKKLKKFQLRTDKESARWWRGVQAAEAAAVGYSLIHLMDREGDSYELFADLSECKRRFVIRSCHDRQVQTCLDGPVMELRAALAESTHFAQVDVPISKRTASTIPGNAKKHPAREARIATLRLSALRLQVRRPERSPHLKNRPEALDINLVYVHEIDPPDGADPVEWILATSEPIETLAQVEQIIEWYRTRWLIEEFFKALKTGCALEKRQHESRAAIEIALAIFLPLACQLLDLRNLARRCPHEPASIVLTQTQIDVLQACSRRPPGTKPTVRECFLAIAADGGHIARNGEPGWLTLARGFQRLDDAVHVWTAARRLGAEK
jgi:hypothetical protein